MELYRAFGSSVDAHKAVLAAHPMYANLMERALAKVVLQHVTTLEKFCQVLHLAAAYVNIACFCKSSKCCRFLFMAGCHKRLVAYQPKARMTFLHLLSQHSHRAVSLDTTSAKSAWHGPS